MLRTADVFVSHGGMNSISESLVYGVPLVVIPFESDQPINAKCVEKLGVGKKLDYSSVTKNVLKECVFSVLSDADIKKNIAAVQELIKNSPGNAGGAEIIIDYYNRSNR